MRVLVVGSGFGGVKTALELSQVRGLEVSLMSDRANFEYYSALYRSATGKSPLEVVIPLRNIFPQKRSKVELILDKALTIDQKHKTLSGESGRRYSYDFLVLAVGQVSCHYGVAGMAENAHSIDTISTTIKLREHLHDMVLEPNRTNLNFVVVGGGASGTELSAELEFYIKDLCRWHKLKDKTLDVILVEANSKVLAHLSQKASDIAVKRLESLGVKVMLDRRAEELKTGELITNDMTIGAGTVIWTAGFTNNPFFMAQEKGLFEFGKFGRVKVDRFLRANHDIYVIGDSADTKFSGMAQTALHQAQFVAHDIRNRFLLEKRGSYKPKRPIYAIPVGGDFAVIQWGPVVIKGRKAWILRRLADLRLFINLEPLHRAVKTWRQGKKPAESVCPVCKVRGEQK